MNDWRCLTNETRLSEPEVVSQLNAQFDKLRKTRTERSEQYTAWFDQLKETRRERSKKIRERSDAMEQELVAMDEKDQAQRQPSALKQVGQTPAEMCDKLLELLQDIQPSDNSDPHNNSSMIDGDRIRVVQGDPVNGVDTSVLLVPMSALELFWHMDVVVPACLSEVDDTIQEIKKRKNVT
ncbi:hypothetical protein BCR43DRAFT_496554 [Syncephalastrum racemosum]|uniref:Uncharacterized protein n=1 Tax=Syncephalastrum racemosum TaxID=13706 RepID=A0A1X2H4A9_SYNRA|nr:hypothetical protein BCR43DRAFT_496554 [Syncephalastrum racemosum]